MIGYDGNKSIAFEEFDSHKVNIEEFLHYTDIYYCMMPCRYFDVVGIYDTVYITSNISFEEQYKELKYSLSTIRQYQAFCRRITEIIEYKEDGSIIEHKKVEKEELSWKII